MRGLPSEVLRLCVAIELARTCVNRLYTVDADKGSNRSGSTVTVEEAAAAAAAATAAAAAASQRGCASTRLPHCAGRRC
eukprot:6180284-Pleurochrysis_carterae.AAC.1